MWGEGFCLGCESGEFWRSATDDIMHVSHAGRSRVCMWLFWGWVEAHEIIDVGGSGTRSKATGLVWRS